MQQTEILKNVRFNMAVNLLDGAFFGFGLGFASSVTVVPLFVNTLTDNTAIIGLLASIHMVGWQLPQILTANRVARLGRVKPMVLMMTLHERWPFLAMALVIFMLPTLGPSLTLVLTFLVLTAQALGGGFTGTAWQSLIGKVIPQRQRGAFWGAQTAIANLTMAAAGYLSGRMLVDVEYPRNFALCFLIAGVTMMASWTFVALTREPERENSRQKAGHAPLSWSHVGAILRSDANYRLFVLARFLAQFGAMGVSFYTVYGVRRFGMDEAAAGIMLGVLTLGGTAAGPILGWMGDRIGHRPVLALSMLVQTGSALLALIAPSDGWLYPAFALAGIGGAGIWTIGMTMTLEFGTDDDRPYYIGLVNTLMAPATLIAPFIGGWLADAVGFEATFSLSLVSALATAALLAFIVRDPPKAKREDVWTTPHPPTPSPKIGEGEFSAPCSKMSQG